MDVKGLLQDLIQVDGLHTAVVVGSDGFVIEGAVEQGRPDAEAVGAHISTGFHAFEVIGKDLMQGSLDQTMAEYQNGMIIMSRIDQDAILAAVADLNANLGYVRFQIKRRAQELRGKL